MDGTVMLVVEDADNFRGQSMVPPAQVGMMTKWKQLKTLVVKHDIEERTMHMQSAIPAQPTFVTSHDDHFRQGSRTQSTEAPVPRASSPCRFGLTVESRRRFASTGKHCSLTVGPVHQWIVMFMSVCAHAEQKETRPRPLWY